MRIRFMAERQDYDVEQLGIFTPKAVPVDELGVGEVGFLVANVKKISDAKIGDTITETSRQTVTPFPGFKELKPMVFAGLYPVEGHEYPELRDALEKLRLNDASFFYEPETLGRARLRLSLWIPRPASPGDRPGAARARVRRRPGDDRAGRALPRDDDRR